MDYAFSIEHGNTTTYITWSAVIAMVVFLLIFAVIIVWFIISKRNKKNSDDWVYTTAVLTGNKNYFKESSFAGGYTHVPEESVEYEVEYWAEGKRYVKWIQVVPSDEKGTEIPIQYNRKHPSRFEEV